MMSSKNALDDFNMSSEELASSSLPERTLLLAVLDRAIRDLHPDMESRYRREALAWFKRREDEDDGSGISYQYCVDTLNLSAAQVDYIKLCIKAASEYDDKSKAEREESRVRLCALAEGESSPLSQAFGTIQRRGRTFRRTRTY